MWILYFATIATTWTLIWWAVYSVATRPKSLAARIWAVSHFRPAVLALLIGSFVLYATTYPFALTLARHYPPIQPLMDLYVPIQWTVDNTPARHSLLKVAEFTNVRTDIEESIKRRQDRAAWGRYPRLAGTAAAFTCLALAIIPPLVAAKWQHRREYERP
ncbi:MAG: hypothetical protein AB8G99_19150 [Planctomycetaceae bacterium]